MSLVMAVRDVAEVIADRIADVAVEAEFAHLHLCEIILVDDASRDLTWAVLQSLARQEPHLRPMRLRRPFGFSAAREPGVLAATCDIVVTLDGDAPLTELARLAGLIEAGHHVVVTRRAKRSRLDLLGYGDSGNASEQMVGFGMPISMLVAAAAAVLPLVMLLGAALTGSAMAWASVLMASLVLLAVGLQLAGLSLIAGLVIRRGRRGRAKSRVAETLLGRGARD